MNADTGSAWLSCEAQNHDPVFPEGRSMCSGKIRTAEVIVTKCHHAIPPVIPPVAARFSIRRSICPDCKGARRSEIQTRKGLKSCVRQWKICAVKRWKEESSRGKPGSAISRRNSFPWAGLRMSNAPRWIRSIAPSCSRSPGWGGIRVRI